MQAQRIILFTIGSVQEFINTSRKTVDLQNASNIMGDVIIATMHKLIDDFKGEVILPVIHDKMNPLNGNETFCPNYFIASYTHEEPVGEQLQQVANTEFSQSIQNIITKDNIRNNFIKIQKFNNSANNEIVNDDLLEHMVIELYDQIQKQLQTALDIYWCDIPFDKDLKTCIDILYKEMEAVKNTRNYIIQDEPEGEKCHLCGVRNAVFCKPKKKQNYPFKIQKYYTYKDDKEIFGSSIYELFSEARQKHPGNIICQYRFDHKFFIIDVSLTDNEYISSLKAGECLCAVCMAKRLRDTRKSSPKIYSLSGYALHDWLEKFDPGREVHDSVRKEITQPNKLEQYKGLTELLKECPDDYQVFYKLWEEACDTLKEQFKIKKGLEDIPAPPLYYCLYRMDIDDLGKKLIEAEDSQKFSAHIFCFFKAISDLVRTKQEYSTVRIVYAGGDDLLALMPIDKYYQFAIDLKTEFDQIFYKDFQDKYGGITYSQGIFFAHHKTTFSEVLRLSSEKLVEVKSKYQKLSQSKNGTVVSVLTDGYSDQSVFFKNYSSANITIMDELIKYFTNKSTYFHDVLGKEFYELAQIDDIDKLMFRDMFLAEQRRLMERSFKDKKSEDLSQTKSQIIDNTEKLLITFLVDNCSEDKRIDLANYFNLFAIIKKIQSQMWGDLHE